MSIATLQPADFSLILDEANIGIFQLDYVTGQLEIFGRGCLRLLFGGQEERLITSLEAHLSQYCHPADRVRVRQGLDDAADSKKSARIVYRLGDAVLGQWHWVSLSGECRLGLEGQRSFLGSLQVVDDCKTSEQAAIALREADERVRIMLDATPLCCSFWSERCVVMACNQEAVRLFGLSSKQEYLERFFELFPETQPDGRHSVKEVIKRISGAFATGYDRFECVHRKPSGELIPVEVTLVRVRYGAGHIVLSYTRDLRDLKAMLAETYEANERTRIMLDATPLCCNFWDENYNNIDCNQEAVRLFDLKSKQEYLDRFMELSPEIQPDGRPTAEKALEKIKLAFSEGYARFEWMHQKLNGEPVPSEITLVRVRRGEN